MQTSIIGYPRVGTLRELKFATEQYFRHEITDKKLEQAAGEIQKRQWLGLKEHGLDFIPSNDFSYYDTLLDTAVLFGIIPARYTALGLSPLDTYFAMARGYQGKNGDVKAFAMKKWFNTNYHYMVAEIEDETQIKLAGTKPFTAFAEAAALGVQTKPVIVGPFTLLRLLCYTGEKRANDFAEALVNAYAAYIARMEALGAQWLQLDEPYLVCDLKAEDITLFETLYTKLLARKGKTKILLQTYFGDVRDIYEHLVNMDFDGIGLDFVEGKQTEKLIGKYGFPKDKLLFAGVVNGKNIWRNDYRKTLTILERLKKAGIYAVIGTSCSLLHVPYTLSHETALSDSYKEHFAFAEEKLGELAELKVLSEQKDWTHTDTFCKNAALFTGRTNCVDLKVQERIHAIRKENFVRLPVFEEREKIQKEVFHLPLFPTTTIGSFPQTQDVKAARSALKKGEITASGYTEFNHKKIAECIALQEELGFDVLVHGEYERNDMVEYFGERLNGYLFTEKAWVQSYGTRCVKPPIIWGDISRPQPMTVEWSVYAQSLTQKPVKGMLTGPVTILNWSFPREDISVKESIYQIALAIRDEVLDLEANGIRIIQVDEAALREKLPLRKSDWDSEYLDFAIPAFRLVHSGVKADTQIHTHMCYSEFTDIIPAIDDMDADVITFEASRSNLQILDALKEHHFKTEVGPGVYDIHSPRVPSVAELKETLDRILKKVDAGKLWVNPDCGLKTRGIDETKASLKNLVAAAAALRSEK